MLRARSMPLVKPPRYLYHATAQCVEERIKAEGLKAHPMSGGVYMATSPQNCMTFMAHRLLAHVHGAKRVVIHDREWDVPDIEMHDYAAVFKVYVHLLDPER